MAKFPVIKYMAKESSACVQVTLNPQAMMLLNADKGAKECFLPENVDIPNLIRKRQNHLRMPRSVEKNKSMKL